MHTGTPDLSPLELTVKNIEKALLDNKYNQTDTAAVFDVPVWLLRRRITALGVPYRELREAFQSTQAERFLRRVESGESLVEVAAAEGMSASNVFVRLKAHGVSVGEIRAAAKAAAKAAEADAAMSAAAAREAEKQRKFETYADAYAELGTLTKVAERMGTYPKQVSRVLNAGGIDVADEAEMRRRRHVEALTEKCVAAYAELGTSAKVAEQLGVTPTFVSNVLEIEGIDASNCAAAENARLEAKKKRAEALVAKYVAAYDELGHVADVAERMGVGKVHTRNVLIAAGIDVNKRR